MSCFYIPYYVGPICYIFCDILKEPVTSVHKQLWYERLGIVGLPIFGLAFCSEPYLWVSLHHPVLVVVLSLFRWSGSFHESWDLSFLYLSLVVLAVIPTGVTRPSTLQSATSGGFLFALHSLWCSAPWVRGRGGDSRAPTPGFPGAGTVPPASFDN